MRNEETYFRLCLRQKKIGIQFCSSLLSVPQFACGTSATAPGFPDLELGSSHIRRAKHGGHNYVLYLIELLLTFVRNITYFPILIWQKWTNFWTKVVICGNFVRTNVTYKGITNRSPLRVHDCSRSI